jgi:CHAT domain-containing protein
MKALASYEYRIAKSAFAPNNGGSLTENTTMTRQQIKHALTSAIPTIVCAIALALSFWVISATEARAQTDAQSEGEQMEQGFKKLSAEEAEKLRAIIAAPTIKDVLTHKLSIQIDEKRAAAEKLGDPNLRLQVHREGAELLPDPHHRNNLARELLSRGEIAEGNKWMLEALKASTNDYKRAFYFKNIAMDMYRQNRNIDAWQNIDKAESILKNLYPKQNWEHLEIARTKSGLQGIKSYLYGRKGEYQASIEAVNSSISYGRQAVGIARRDIDKIYVYQDLVSLLNRKLYVLMEARKLGDAEIALQEYLRLFQEAELSASEHAFAFGNAAWLRFNQREFVAQENLTRKSIASLEKLGHATTDPRLLNAQNRLALSLFGQKKYAESLAIYAYFDKLALDNSAIKRRLEFTSDRARTYLFNNMPQQALPLLASASTSNAKLYGLYPSGAQHFFTAQASGQQGVALWRIGTPESKAQAYSLLQNSVHDYMAPENVDYLENIGIYKEVRELIFSTYLEAASQVNAANAVAALGVADWMRGGLVQEALGDAAVRAAASNDTLSNLVRQDQDARNEIKGLRNFLSGDAGGSSSPLPQIAAQMRERITLLEKTRADVQVKIKAAFPDYEKLVRPSPPSTANIQANLQADEALVVLQPTDNATYVWVLSRSGGNGAGTFHRANIGNADLAKLVKRLRVSLDVAGLATSRMPAFDHAAAQELYAQLLAPLEQGLAGKTSLVIAAGGVLGQIPFGILETAAVPRTVAMKDTPWLIKKAAITHVPSVAAWLSMRALPHQTASQPMLAWGDPLFNLALASNAKSSSGEVRKINLTRAATAVDLEKEDVRSAIKYADIPALPETRDELLAIAKTLGADATRDLILGSQATRDSVLAQNKNGNLAKQRVVAFATHGLMAGDLPNLTQPALAMAGTKDDLQNVLAPLLTLEDVLTLKLNADWVVLSACNTAAADGQAEEALSGLARGFFYAGSRSLLVTHWAVDSESAVTLTTETFKNYQSKPTEAKAESLRQAMLTVMANLATAHPTYWAPYALVGDGAR